MQSIDFKTIATVGSTIAALLAAYFTYVHTVVPTKKSVQYYEKILLPFIQEYHKNSGRNWTKFLSRIIRYDYDYIPPYIFYLIKSKKYSNEQIESILLNDYRLHYKNDYNSASRISEQVLKIVVFLAYFVSLFLYMCSLMAVVLFLLYIILILVMNNLNELKQNIRFLIVSVLLAVSSYGLISYSEYLLEDEYTLKESRIKKKIKRKLNNFEKYKNKYYL